MLVGYDSRKDILKSYLSHIVYIIDIFYFLLLFLDLIPKVAFWSVSFLFLRVSTRTMMTFFPQDALERTIMIYIYFKKRKKNKHYYFCVES